MKRILLVVLAVFVIGILGSLVSYASSSKQERCVIQMKLHSEGKSILDIKNWDKGVNWEPYCEAKIYFEEEMK